MNGDSATCCSLYRLRELVARLAMPARDLAQVDGLGPGLLSDALNVVGVTTEVALDVHEWKVSRVL